MLGLGNRLYACSLKYYPHLLLGLLDRDGLLLLQGLM